jgi:ABC-2 type transport system permease protein
MMLARALNVVRKEFRQVLRDKRTYPIVFVAPILQLFLYGYAATFDLHRLPVAVVDADRGPESRALLRAVEASGEFHLAYFVDALADAEKLVDHGSTRVVLSVPPDFGRRVREGKGGKVGLFFDGSDSNTATVARSSLEAIVARHAIGLTVDRTVARDGQSAGLVAALEGPEGLPEALEVRTRILYNPELRSANYMVPGVVVIILLMITAMLSALSIVKEKEIGTFEMLLATPIRPVELMVGKLAPFVTIGFIDVLLVLTVAANWFEVPLRGSIGLLLALAGAFVMTSIAGGLLVSTVASSQQQAMIISFLTLLPMVLLSGLIFPIDSMPAPVRALSYALPIRYFLEATRAIFLRGVGLEVLWPNAVAMVGLGAALLAGAILRFRARM